MVVYSSFLTNLRSPISPSMSRAQWSAHFGESSFFSSTRIYFFDLSLYSRHLLGISYKSRIIFFHCIRCILQFLIYVLMFSTCFYLRAYDIPLRTKSYGLRVHIRFSSKQRRFALPTEKFTWS